AVPTYRLTLGGGYCNLGMISGTERKAKEALEWFDLAVSVLRPLLEADPRDTFAADFLFKAYTGRALILEQQLKHPAEADKDWELAAAVGRPEQRASARASRVQGLKAAGRHAEAAEQLDRLLGTDLLEVPPWN